MFETYKPSGRFSPIFILWLLAGVVVVAFLAFVYQLGLTWIPLIYVNFLLTMAFGFAIGAIGHRVVQWGKVRSVPIGVLILATLLVTAMGAKFGFQYLAACNQLKSDLDKTTIQELEEIIQTEFADAAPEERPEATPELLEQFRHDVYANFSFVDHIKERIERGWVVGRRGNGPPLKGWFVGLVWLIELGFIVKAAWLATISSAKEPFNEKLDVWASQKEIDLVLPITGQEMIDKINAVQTVQDLLELPIPTSDASNQYAVYTVHSIPGDDREDAYLSVELQTHSTNSKGEEEIKKQPLVKLAILTKAQRELLRQNAEDINAAFAAFHASQHAQTQAVEEADESPA